MDFAFAPGVTRYDRTIRLLYGNRADTTLINNPRITDVAGYIHFLNSIAPDPTTAATSIHIGSHGDDNAWMWVQWDNTGGKNTTWEDLDNAHNSGSTEIQDEIILPRPTEGNTEIPPRLLIKGCRIALSQGFMDKMKEAINGSTTETLTVTAPKFYHALLHYFGKGVFEYFCYDFKTFSKTRIANKNDLVNALLSEHHTDIHGNSITEEQYRRWIPSNINSASDTIQRVTIAPTPITRFERKTTGRYRHTNATILRVTADINPPAGADDRAALLISLLTEEAENGTSAFANSLREDHPFPLFTRYGYTDIADMVDNLTLTFTRQNAHSVLIIGKRHEYDVNPPVVDADGDTLLFNYYASAGSNTVSQANFTDTDDRFYITT